jgi:hypothetical protein
VLDLGSDRLLLLRTYGGVLCSVDAGVTWRPRCQESGFGGS